MATVTLSNVVKRFGAFEVVHGANIDIKHGEFVVFVLSLIHISEPTRPY